MVRLRVNRAEKKARKKAKPRKMKRRGGGKAKGSAFERAFCKELSLWWSDGEGDDHFWRSSMSGGRATVRRQRTANSYGDVAAMTPLGSVFTETASIELKTGYPGANILDLISSKESKGVYDLWIKQAKMAGRLAGTLHWMVVHKSHARNPIMILPKRLWELILGQTCNANSMAFLFHWEDEEVVVAELRLMLNADAEAACRRFKVILRKEKQRHGIKNRNTQSRNGRRDPKDKGRR